MSPFTSAQQRPHCAIQNQNLQTLVSILNSTKATDIPSIVKSLSTDAQDTLMKYLYKGMALPGWGDVSGSVLLGWHEKVRAPRAILVVRVVSSRGAVDGSRGYWLYCAGDDGQEDCITHQELDCTISRYSQDSCFLASTHERSKDDESDGELS